MKTTIYTIILSATIVACSSKPDGNSDNSQDALTDSKEIAKETSTDALADYIALKDVLVMTDVVAVKKGGKALSNSMKAEKFDESLIEAANQIATSDNVEEQRAFFKTITDKMIEIVREKDLEGTIYVQYCPMAFDNTGASWLSLSDEIRNPYFGNKMLKCGRVTEEL